MEFEDLKCYDREGRHLGAYLKEIGVSKKASVEKEVVRWCSECGVVVDIDFNDKFVRVAQEMQFPR